MKIITWKPAFMILYLHFSVDTYFIADIYFIFIQIQDK